MEIKILSHACLLVKSGGHSVIVDPWLLGSCYWRSWWNYPQAEFDIEELAEVDAVIISHVHWDHWHGPTLKKFFRDKPVIVPDEPGQRSRRDLASIGFTNVRALTHGESFSIGAIRLTLYQFGLFLNDAAVVIEAEGITILDANDAKIAGSVLTDIIRRHGPVTFALRSHSSANPRVQFKIAGDPDFKSDDREHYFRSFRLFMDAVKPTYAVPFASNHCHLHDDVFALNGYISNPFELADYLAKVAPDSPWQLATMLPGSVWDSKTGFTLANQDAYDDLADKLAAYRVRISGTLASYRAEEMAIKLSPGSWKRLTALWQKVPANRRGTGVVGIVAVWPDGSEAVMDMDAATGVLTAATESVPRAGRPVMRFPAIVLRDAIFKNMFHHAGISKRCEFVASNAHDLAWIGNIFGALEKVELGLYPLDRSYLKRLLGAYRRRWREVAVYVQAAWYLKVRRLPIYLVEERILEGSV